MANEGTWGSLGGMGAGAGIGALLAGASTGGIGAPLGAALGASAGGSLGGIVGGLFTKKPKGPDISGELARISGLFAQLREQNTANINRQAAQGRSAAASNLAGRGVYSSGVSEHTFNRLEEDRLNSIANSNAALAGQEAQIRSQLLQSLMGLDADAQARAGQIDAAMTGALTGLSSSLLSAILQGRMLGGAPAATTPQVPNSPLLPWTQAAFPAAAPVSPVAYQRPQFFTGWPRG